MNCIKQIILFACLGAVQSNAQQPGDLDTTFGNDGIVLTSFDTQNVARALLIEPDGRIIAGGSIGPDFGIVRYSADGMPDSTFGTAGKVLNDFNQQKDEIWSMDKQPDGKILVSGYSGTDFAIARYLPDWMPDTTFGNGGRVVTNFDSSSYGIAQNIKGLFNGKILAGGIIGSGIALAQYKSNGDLDSTFGLNGKVITSLPNVGGASLVITPFSMFVMQSGKILIAASVNTSTSGTYYTSSGVLVRYNPDGTLDNSFGNNGITEPLPDIFEFPSKVIMLPDNKIIVAGISTSAYIRRYTSQGNVDSSFGTNGVYYSGYSSDSNSPSGASSAVLQPDGKIVTGGYIRGWAGERGFVVTRTLPDGQKDSTFGENGLVATAPLNNDWPFEIDYAFATVLQADGKIILAGTTEAGNGISRIALTRYHGSTSNDTVTSVISPRSLDAAIVVYPNPAKNIVYLDVSNGAPVQSLLLNDASGKTIRHYPPQARQLNLEGIEEGAYILQIKIKNIVVNKKVIVLR